MGFIDDPVGYRQAQRANRQRSQAAEYASLAQGAGGLLQGFGQLRRSNIASGQQQLLAQQMGDVASGAQTPQQAAEFAAQSARDYGAPGFGQRLGQLFGAPGGVGASPQQLNPQGAMDLATFSQKLQGEQAAAGIATRKEARSVEAHQTSQAKAKREAATAVKRQQREMSYSDAVLGLSTVDDLLTNQNADKVVKNAERSVHPDDMKRFREEHGDPRLMARGIHETQVAARVEEGESGLATGRELIYNYVNQLRYEKENFQVGNISRASMDLMLLKNFVPEGEEREAFAEEIKNAVRLSMSGNLDESNMGMISARALRESALTTGGLQAMRHAYMVNNAKINFALPDIPLAMNAATSAVLKRPTQKTLLDLLRRIESNPNYEMAAGMLTQGKFGKNIKTLRKEIEAGGELTSETARHAQWFAQQLKLADPRFAVPLPPEPAQVDLPYDNPSVQFDAPAMRPTQAAPPPSPDPGIPLSGFSRYEDIGPELFGDPLIPYNNVDLRFDTPARARNTPSRRLNLPRNKSWPQEPR